MTQVLTDASIGALVGPAPVDWHRVAVPTSGSPTALLTSGNLGSGVYAYGVTYYTDIGETDIYLVPTTVTTDGTHQQVSLTIPVSPDSLVLGRKIYRTKVNGSQAHDLYYIATVADNTSTVYTDNIADAAVGAFVTDGKWNTTATIRVNGIKAMGFNATGALILPVGLVTRTGVIGCGDTRADNHSYFYASGYSTTTAYPSYNINYPASSGNFGIGPNSTSGSVHNLQIGICSTYGVWGSPSNVMQVVLNSTTPSSSTSTGCLVLAGGLGMAGELFLGKYIKMNVYTVATLPTGSQGMKAFVSDATATTFASVVAGGGANPIPVYHDGTNWRIG